ncbi:DEAD/DEAH box helicase [Corynebacterium sp.]|uniref:DEAD/DEAH box helicase n=1 Tax=Corynebacterium sp. TaxID=1720 RepID=UPI0026DD00E0|nr:helicase-related protein [Corynebacterium sp.]MDO5031291.1 helicase-related protein [Corynebacterium sp.]
MHYVVHETTFTYDEPYLFWPDLDNALASDTTRNRLIAQVITEAAHSGHNVMVLTKRREHLAHLRTLVAQGSQHALFELHGGQTAQQRQHVLEQLSYSHGFIVLAMAQVAGEGLDLPDIDALVLAAPVAFKGNIIQNIGRVTRDATGTEGSAATIHDFNDSHVPALSAAFRKRARVIKKQGFNTP